jgi:hypothetical protein
VVREDPARVIRLVVRVNESVVFFCRRESNPGTAVEQQLGTSVFRRELPVGFAVAFQKMVVSNCNGPTYFG